MAQVRKFILIVNKKIKFHEKKFFAFYKYKKYATNFGALGMTRTPVVALARPNKSRRCFSTTKKIPNYKILVPSA